MADKKYQVFISSTYSDLKDERRKVLDVLLMADCIPAGMEAFVATDNEQFEVIKKVIDLCDYYVLIIGKRYGSVNPVTEISYTEMEYDYAKDKGIPVLVFAIDDSVDLPEEKVEQDKGNVEKLKRFRAHAMTNRLATVWKTSDELTGALAVSIMRAKNEITRPGWQRATEYDEATLRREIMELQEQNKGLILELDNAKATIASFSERSDVSFDDCIFEIKYHYMDGHYKRVTSASVALPELFSVIATEMMDVAITELSVRQAIKSNILNDHIIDDDQVIKRILNQLKALNLVRSFWDKEKNVLYWGLTEKGRKVRDDMILVRKKEK